MRYHVFIDGCRDTTAEGIDILASALGHRYGMSAPALIRRLKEGRFCARASLELVSAQELAAELEALGARVSLIGETPGAARPAAPQAFMPAPTAAAAPAAAQRYESGLAAAFAGDRLRDDVRLDLGPLAAAGEDSQTLTDTSWELAHIDGTRETESPAASARRRPAGPTPTMRGTPAPMPLPAQRASPSWSASPPRSRETAGAAEARGSSPPRDSRGSNPPGDGARPSAGPPPIPTARDSSQMRTLRESSPPMQSRGGDSSPPAPQAPDPFRPPDEGRLELPELAEIPTRVVAVAAPEAAPAADPAGPRRNARPSVRGAASLVGASFVGRFRDAMAGSSRARFAAGVAIAFFVGLVPAQLYAWSRADSAYEDIRAELQSDYRAAETPEQWATLAGAREVADELARSRQRRLAISSCLLWLAAAGAIGFVWFRLIDWGPALAPQTADAARARRRSTM